MNAADLSIIALALIALAVSEYIAVAIVTEGAAVLADLREAERTRRERSIRYQGCFGFLAANDSDAADVLIDRSAERMVWP